jgi:hypothetical protein
MPRDNAKDTIIIPARHLAELASLLTRLDEFLRSGDPATSALTSYLASRGETHPGFAACNLIDEVSSACGLRHLTGEPSGDHR